MTSSGDENVKEERSCFLKQKSYRVFFIIGDRLLMFDRGHLHLRVLNLIRALEKTGAGGDLCLLSEVPSKIYEILSYQIIVIVRAPMNETLEVLISKAERAGIPLVFDMDDYLFNPGIIGYFHHARSYSEKRWDEFIKGIYGYKAVLEACPYFTAPTSSLAREGKLMGRKTFVISNTLSREWLEASERERIKRQTNIDGRECCIGYFAGTHTHQKDFAVAMPSLLRLLEDHKSLTLVVTDALDLEEFPEINKFLERIEVLPHVYWQDLPAQMAVVDINIVPLEITRFCESKSELKYVHAGSLAIPTVASPTRPYRETIVHGLNGFLAANDDEWYETLKNLVMYPEKRREMGLEAYKHVMKAYTVEHLLPSVKSIYEQIIN